MQNKNNNRSTLIGTLLISLLIMLFMYNRASNAEQPESTEGEETTTEEVINEEPQFTAEDVNVEDFVETTTVAEINDTAAIDSTVTQISQAELDAMARYAEFNKSAFGTEKELTIENDLLRIVVSNKGAQIKTVELKEFKTYSQEALLLIDNSQSLNFQFYTQKGSFEVNTKDLYHEISFVDEQTISAKLKLNDNQYIEQLISVEDGNYLVDFDLKVVNLSEVIPANKNSYLKAEWDYSVNLLEQDVDREKMKSTIYWKEKGDDVENLSIGSSDDEEIDTDIEWLSYKQQFFNATLLSLGIFEKVEVESTINKEDSASIGDYSSAMYVEYVPGATVNYDMQMYFGPNDYKLLKSQGRDLHNIVDLSADFFLLKWVKYINKWVIIPLFNLLEKTGMGYGLIILILTLVIKMILMPLTFKSYVSSAKMKLLKPELDALKKKHGDDQQKYATAQMQLYNKAGVNMFGGCLPTMLQMPFLLAMFYFFPSSIELRQESFLWAHDLSTYDNIFNLPFTIPFYGDHVSLFTLLMTVSSILYARVNMQNQAQSTQPGMEMMKYMPYMMPVFLMFMFNSWAAALTYYYFLSNMISFGQQLAIKKFFIDEEKLKKQLEENKKKKPKKSGFAAKMEEIYRIQQQEQAKKSKKK